MSYRTQYPPIEPFDTAGLRDRSRRDWYPMLATDLVASAAKLEASPADVTRLLERCGLAGTLNRDSHS